VKNFGRPLPTANRQPETDQESAEQADAQAKPGTSRAELGAEKKKAEDLAREALKPSQDLPGHRHLPLHSSSTASYGPGGNPQKSLHLALRRNDRPGQNQKGHAQGPLPRRPARNSCTQCRQQHGPPNSAWLPFDSRWRERFSSRRARSEGGCRTGRSRISKVSFAFPGGRLRRGRNELAR